MDAETPWSWLRASLYALISRNPASNRVVVDLCELGPEDSLLDIGCGPGAAVRSAAERAMMAVGVDNSEAMVRLARRRSRGLANVEFREGAAESIPSEDGAFSRVITVQAFHHWTDKEAGLREASRVLMAGGRFLIAERSSKGKHGITLEAAGHLADRLTDLGFSRAHTSSHGSLILVEARKELRQ